MMKTKFFTKLLIFAVFGAAAFADTRKADDSKIAGSKEPTKVRYDEIEVYVILPKILLRSAATPTFLENHYNYCVRLRYVEQWGKFHELVRIISDISNDEGDGISDYRFAIIGYNENRKRVMELYLDAFGRRGVLDGRSVVFKGEIKEWILKNFPQPGT